MTIVYRCTDQQCEISSFFPLLSSTNTCIFWELQAKKKLFAYHSLYNQMIAIKLRLKKKKALTLTADYTVTIFSLRFSINI